MGQPLVQTESGLNTTCVELRYWRCLKTTRALDPLQKIISCVDWQLRCEIAMHATDDLSMDTENACKIIIKIDIRNAFNNIESNIVLGIVFTKVIRWDHSCLVWRYKTYNNTIHFFAQSIGLMEGPSDPFPLHQLAPFAIGYSILTQEADETLIASPEPRVSKGVGDHLY
ncbi:hypothetical protein EVAR_28958_1 [Eumeta japonica]|uniref:Uncharacterized protein n=1 Tax=Eumeta variegata TaxID=151549 RepID=A0A4C1VZP8_EUMVA|nr:hypothetical protein EVAR_28958_1 [Eumeta japonica]